MTKVKDFWEVIEEAPSYCENIAGLAQWATNYDYQTGTPFLAFLDLTGYSEEFIGSRLNPAEFILDFASAETFAAALNEWANRPGDCLMFIQDLMNAD